MIEQAKREKKEAVSQNMRAQLDPKKPQVFGTGNLLYKVKLGINFIKLAELALKYKIELSGFLALREPNQINRIPFYLESRKFQLALELAIKSGDPNQIN